MLTKIAILFLLAMVGLAMIGRLFRAKPPRLPPPVRDVTPPRCKECGEFIIGKGDCACSAPPRIGRR